MGSITATARLLKRKLPQVDVPVIEGNDEMRRFSESIKEHLRMYEGDSGAPKERFVTIEELEHVGLVTTKVQQGFASIDKVLGEQVSPVPSSNPPPGTGGGASGVRTLRALDDTAIDGIKGGQGIVFNGHMFVPVEFPEFDLENATRYDMMYFDGSKWKHTAQQLQWNPTDDYLQLANEHSINWLDTSDVTKDFLDFKAGAAVASAVGHIILKIAAGVTTTSGSYVAASGYVVPYASMEANTDYAVFVRAYVGNSSSTSTNQNKVKLTKGGTLVGGSEIVFESAAAIINNYAHTYTWGGIISSGSSGDLQLWHLSGNGANTVFVNNLSIVMIKVDDLILGTNIFHDTDTSTIAIDDGDFPSAWSGMGASVTIGDGVSDYLVFGSMGQTNFQVGSNAVSTRITDGSNTQLGTETALGDMSDELTFGFWQLWQAPAAGTTLSLEAMTSGWGVDKYYASIIAIRLDAFIDYASDFLETSPDLGTGPNTLATVAFTTASAGDYGFLSGAMGPNNSSVGVADFIRNDLNSTGDATIGGSETQLGAANSGVTQTFVHFGVSADQALSATDTIDADFVANDAATPVLYKNSFLAVFQWAISITNEFFDVGNVGYTTRNKGLTTRFYDPGLTDYLEISHNGTVGIIGGANTSSIYFQDAGEYEFFDSTNAVSWQVGVGLTSILIENSVEHIDVFWEDGDGNLYYTFNFAGTNDEGFVINRGNKLTLTGTTAANKVDMQHDNTDFNLNGANTTDFNITGFTAIQAGTVNADFAALTATTYGGITEANLVDKSADEDIAGNWNFKSGSGGTDFLNTGGTVGLNIAHPGGNDVLISTVGAVQDVKFSGASVQYDFDNNVVVAGDVGGTTIGGITEANLLDKSADEGIAVQLQFSGNWLEKKGGIFYVTSADNTQYLNMNSDGTDFNWVFTGTTDWNISGITTIQAGAVNADFAALTATSYGGITEANLLDKTATEDVAGAWTFSGNRIDLEGPSARFVFKETGVSADNSVWRFLASGEGFFITVLNDAESAAADFFSVQRTGVTVDEVKISGSAFYANTTKVGFYVTAPVAKQTGVAVSSAGIHAALVNLGLIT